MLKIAEHVVHTWRYVVFHTYTYTKIYRVFHISLILGQNNDDDVCNFKKTINHFYGKTIQSRDLTQYTPLTYFVIFSLILGRFCFHQTFITFFILYIYMYIYSKIFFTERFKLRFSIYDSSFIIYFFFYN